MKSTFNDDFVVVFSTTEQKNSITLSVKSSPSQSSSNSNTRCPSESRKYFVPTKFGDHKEPTSLPVNLGVRLTSRSSPSLAITKEELEDELDERDFPHPDYSPEQIRRSDKNTHFKHVSLLLLNQK